MTRLAWDSRSQINVRTSVSPRPFVLIAGSALMLSVLTGLQMRPAAASAAETAAAISPTVTLTVRDFVEGTPIGGAKVTMSVGGVPFASGITSGSGVFIGAGAPLNQHVRVEWKQIGYVRTPEIATLTVGQGDNPIKGTLLKDSPDTNYMLRIPEKIIEAAGQSQASKEMAYQVQWERVTLLPADAQAAVAKALATGEGHNYLANVASFKAASTSTSGSAVSVPRLTTLPADLSGLSEVKVIEKAATGAKAAAEKSGSTPGRGSSVP